MKVSQLIEELQKLDKDNDLYLEADGKMFQIELVRNGQFYKTNVVSARVDYDIIRAEQTLISTLQFQPEAMDDVIKGRIARAIGNDRVEFLTKVINEAKEKANKELEENKDIIEEVQEAVNSQTGFDEPTEEIAPKKKISKKLSKANAEALLLKFYGGDSSVSVEEVKKAKDVVGQEKADELFKKARS